jgi:hypothetical protein
MTPRAVDVLACIALWDEAIEFDALANLVVAAWRLFNELNFYVSLLSDRPRDRGRGLRFRAELYQRYQILTVILVSQESPNRLA